MAWRVRSVGRFGFFLFSPGLEIYSPRFVSFSLLLPRSAIRRPVPVKRGEGTDGRLTRPSHVLKKCVGSGGCGAPTAQRNTTPSLSSGFLVVSQLWPPSHKRTEECSLDPFGCGWLAGTNGGGGGRGLVRGLTRTLWRRGRKRRPGHSRRLNWEIGRDMTHTTGGDGGWGEFCFSTNL